MGKGDGRRCLLQDAGSSHGGAEKAVPTSLRGLFLPPSPAGNPTIFQAEVDQWDVLVCPPQILGAGAGLGRRARLALHKNHFP